MPLLSFKSQPHCGEAVQRKLTCSGLYVRAFNPTMNFDTLGNTEWTVELQDMWTLLQSIWLEVGAESPAVAGALPKLTDDSSMISDSKGSVCLIAVGTECLNPEITRAAAGAADVVLPVTCEVCGKNGIEPTMLRHHIGAHLLQADWSAFSKLRPDEPCGLCGIRQSY